MILTILTKIFLKLIFLHSDIQEGVLVYSLKLQILTLKLEQINPFFLVIF